MESNQIQKGQDKAEEIRYQGIGWNVYGKITNISRTPESTKSALTFGYDATGNRTYKTEIPASGTSNSTTWYVRDAQSNILATYKTVTAKSDGALLSLTLLEQNIYGSSRLGLTERNLTVTTLGTTPEMQRNIGIKRYELTDHLGNVLEVITDKKRPIDDGVYSATGTKTSSVPDGIIDYYLPSILSATAYYPFGMQMPGLGANPASYRYGFNGKEKDDEWHSSAGTVYDYGFRIYDARVARFLSVDPLTKEYPELSTYQFASNTPIQAIDLDGLEAFFIHGMNSNPKDWETEEFRKVIETTISFTSNNTLDNANTSFDWSDRAKKKINVTGNRTKAAIELVKYIKVNRIEGEDVTLVGVSHGGNVIIQAAKLLAEEGYKVNVIIYNIPAENNEADPENPNNNEGINDMTQFYTEGDWVVTLLGTESRTYDKPPKTHSRVKVKMTNDATGTSKHKTKNINTKYIDKLAKDKMLRKQKPIPEKNQIPVSK